MVQSVLKVPCPSNTDGLQETKQAGKFQKGHIWFTKASVNFLPQNDEVIICVKSLNFW